MPRSKLRRYTANKQDNLVLQAGYQDEMMLAGQWSRVFGNDHPLTVELACGRGEYSVYWWQQFPDRNFVGMDIKGERLYVGAQRARSEGLTNVRFVRGQIHAITKHFAPGEVSELLLIHPDPRPKGSDERKRLTHPRFLAMYAQVLAAGGSLLFKTDDADLFLYSLDAFAVAGWSCEWQTVDLYDTVYVGEHYGVQTHYEKLALAAGKTIKSARFRRP